MSNETEARAGADVPTSTAGIPAVEVNPSNELQDGANLERKADLLANEPVHVDASGTRLEHDDPDVIAPPASANLELRQRTEKLIAGTLGSMGKGEESPDSMVAALREEHRGLSARADDGDEKAVRRVKQVEEQLKARGASVIAADAGGDPESSAAQRQADAERRAADGEASGAARKVTPAGRAAKPKTQS